MSRCQLADEIIRGNIGRKFGRATKDFSNHSRLVCPGQHLYMVLTASRVKDQRVACVDTEREYNHYYGQYSGGGYLDAFLYVLTDNEHAQAR